MGLRLLPNGTLGGDSPVDALQAHDAARLRRYREYLDVYDGRHWTRPRPSRTQLTLNYARAIADKGVSFLLGRGLNFSVPDAENGLGRQDAARAERILYETYQDGDLETVDLGVALNSAVLGDGVWKITWDPLERRIRVFNLDPFSFFPRWSGDDLATLWRVDVAYRLAAEEAGRLYGIRLSGGLVEVLEHWTAAELVLMVDRTIVRRGPNPYGFLPFVHVPNLPAPNEFWGTSDLRDVVDLNRALNERMSDQADTIRYHADPPVIFKGVAEHSDLTVGPGTVWDLPADADVKLLEWQGTAPQVEAHLDRLQRAINDVAETPRTAFGDSGRLLSGVALETELRPLIQRTQRKRVVWSAALRQRNRLILQLAERFGYGGARPGQFAPYRTRVIWPPMLPRDDAAEVRNNVDLVAAGLRSHRTAMDVLGTEDPETELARVKEDRARLIRPASDPSPGATGT